MQTGHPLLKTMATCKGGGICVASVSPEDCVEVKQLSVAGGQGAGADSGEV